MIEEIVMEYLEEKLSVPVRLEEEPGIGPGYVLIEKTGGGKTNCISRATLAIQSYGSTTYAAAELNEEVKEAMESIVELDEVSRCSLNSDYNYTDTAQKKHRYQAVFDLVHY